MMKKHLFPCFASAVLAASINNVTAQGMVDFNLRISGWVVGHVYGVGDGVAKTGNTASEWPPGTQTYSGGLLTGDGFSAQLFGGPLGTVETQLYAIGVPSTFRTRSVLVGTPHPQLLSVPGVPGRWDGTFQVRAWDNASGKITSWDQALIRGKSETFIITMLGDGIMDFPAVMENFRSFNINPVGAIGEVPEPCAALIFGLGLIALWLKQSSKQPSCGRAS